MVGKYIIMQKSTDQNPVVGPILKLRLRATKQAGGSADCQSAGRVLAEENSVPGSALCISLLKLRIGEAAGASAFKTFAILCFTYFILFHLQRRSYKKGFESYNKQKDSVGVGSLEWRSFDMGYHKLWLASRSQEESLLVPPKEPHATFKAADIGQRGWLGRGMKSFQDKGK